jgi:4-hydroxyphenylpyruvate dioxygenase
MAQSQSELRATGRSAARCGQTGPPYRQVSISVTMRRASAARGGKAQGNLAASARGTAFLGAVRFLHCSPAIRPRLMSIQIQKLAGLRYYVWDLERTRRYYLERLGFAEVARSSPELEQAERQKSCVLRAGSVLITCTTPLGSGRASRYLSSHPDGIGEVELEVADIHAVFARLEANGATPTSEVRTFGDAYGTLETFAITTPLGDITFRFSERRGYRGPAVGMDAYASARGGHDELGFTEVDHVTLNLRTMKPTLLWLEHVLEFQPFWGVAFHTANGDQDETVARGSGLRSQVMWDPTSGVKIASNEPLRPSFEKSQINQFCDENRGDGVQHVALSVADILKTVRLLRARGVEPMPPPPGYYRHLREHLGRLGVDGIDEDLGALEELGILVDGSAPGAYLLQIFLKDSAEIFGSAQAGPFFFELIQRKGDAGFGAGNFRALFDSVEARQLARVS